MTHDENYVQKNDELVVAKNFLKNSKHACFYLYEPNFLVDLGC